MPGGRQATQRLLQFVVNNRTCMLGQVTGPQVCNNYQQNICHLGTYQIVHTSYNCHTIMPESVLYFIPMHVWMGIALASNYTPCSSSSLLHISFLCTLARSRAVCLYAVVYTPHICSKPYQTLHTLSDGFEPSSTGVVYLRYVVQRCIAVTVPNIRVCSKC